MAEIEELAKEHRRSLPNGYRVRVTGFRLVAEPGGRSFDPRLIAEIAPEDANTRIVGELHWTPVPAVVAMMSVGVLVFSAVAIVLGVAGHWILAAVPGVIALYWVLASVAHARRDDDEREPATQHVRDELRLIFFPETRREGLTSLDQLLQRRPPQ